MPRGGKRVGAGRKPGSRTKKNVVVVEAGLTVGELIRSNGWDIEALQVGHRLMQSGETPAAVRAKLIDTILDRSWGKALQPLEHSGKDGQPIEMRDISELEMARRIAFILTRGAGGS